MMHAALTPSKGQMNWHWRPYVLVLFTLLLPLLSCTQSPTSPPQSEFPLQPSELPPPSHPCHDIYLQLLRESSALSSHKLFNALAVCYHQLDLLPQALKLYEHSILTSNNTFALPFANLAAVALNNGDHVTANALVREYLRGVGFNGSEPEFDDDAIESGSPCRKGADKDGECCMALNNLGAGLLTGGHWTEAEEVLKMAVHIMGNDHVMGDKVFFNLGSVYAEEVRLCDHHLSVKKRANPPGHTRIDTTKVLNGRGSHCFCDKLSLLIQGES